MRRRTVVGCLAALPWLTCAGRSRAAMPTVGYLDVQRPDETFGGLFRASIFEGLGEPPSGAARRLRVIERYGALGHTAPLAAEMVDEGAQVILATGSAALAAIKGAGGRVPVVYAFSGNPIAAGLADSLAQPRGNATGVSLMVVEVNAKRVELLKMLAPSIPALLWWRTRITRVSPMNSRCAAGP